jgi:hypothetical protein
MEHCRFHLDSTWFSKILGISAIIDKEVVPQFQRTLYLKPDDILRWSLASKAMLLYGFPPFSRSDMNYLVLETSALCDSKVVRSCENSIAFDMVWVFISQSGVHLLAWNYTNHYKIDERCSFQRLAHLGIASIRSNDNFYLPSFPTCMGSSFL